MTTKKKAFVASMGMLTLALVVQTQVRTALFASAAGIATFLAYYMYTKGRRAIIITMLFLAGFALIMLPQISYYTNFTSVYDRVYIWKVTLQIWQNNPLFGVGVDAYQDVYKSIAVSGIVSPFITPDGIFSHTPEATHAHNLFLTLLACSGITGLCMFLWLFVNAVRMIFTSLDGWRFGLIAWPCVVVAIGFTGWNIYHSWYQAVFAYFIVLMGCSGEKKETDM